MNATENPSSSSPDVLVAGAGPVGLITGQPLATHCCPQDSDSWRNGGARYGGGIYGLVIAGGEAGVHHLRSGLDLAFRSTSYGLMAISDLGRIGRIETP